MQKFYITFGQKYRNEDHPLFKNQKLQYVHPDGYWEIRAKDKEEAREKAFESLGQYWSMIYEKEPESELFPLGVIGIIN